MCGNFSQKRKTQHTYKTDQKELCCEANSAYLYVICVNLSDVYISLQIFSFYNYREDPYL